MKNRKVYLAYGSNLHLGQMSRRCPDARPLGATTLPNHQLLFRGSRWSAFATVEPKDGVSVPALLWSISPKDELRLDYYEGYPNFYRKETVTVELDGKPIEAMVYIMNDGKPLGSPSWTYYNTILEGYKANGLDLDFFYNAVAEAMGGYPNVED